MNNIIALRGYLTASLHNKMLLFPWGLIPVIQCFAIITKISVRTQRFKHPFSTNGKMSVKKWHTHWPQLTAIVNNHFWKVPKTPWGGYADLGGLQPQICPIFSLLLIHEALFCLPYSPPPISEYHHLHSSHFKCQYIHSTKLCWYASPLLQFLLWLWSNDQKSKSWNANVKK